MSIKLNNESSYELPEGFLLECDQLADYLLLQEQAPLNAVVSITFVDNEEIAALNQEYRDKAEPTDVLSFPCDDAPEFNSEATAEALGDDDPSVLYWADFDAAEDAAPVLLGDVVIAPHVAVAQAEALDKDIFDELRLLLVHGILHLLGYDHEDDDTQAEEMEQREKDILSDWAELNEGESSYSTCGGGCCG